MQAIILAVSLFVSGCWAGGPFLDGTSLGDDGNAFLNGTARTEKLLPGILCYKDNSDSTTTKFTVMMQVNENDNFFVHEGNPDDGKQERYDICQFLDAEEYFTNSKRILSTDSTCMNMTLNDGTGSGDTTAVAKRTHNRVVPALLLTGPDTSVACGGRLNGEDFEFVVRCKRVNGPYDKEFDADFAFSCARNVNTQVLVRRQTTTDLIVEIPSVRTVVRELSVSFDVYQLKTSTLTYGRSLAADKAGEENLGQELYLELCISNKDANQPFFSSPGRLPLGVKAITCWTEFDRNDVDLTDPNYIGKYNDTVVTGGCGAQHEPMVQFLNNVYVFKWVNDDDDADSTDFDVLRSPNCFRSVKFEAVSYQRDNIDTKITTKVFCKLEYCVNTADSSCFGPVYPTCPAAGRRRRQDDDILTFDLPETVGAQFTVVTKQPESAVPEAKTGCFEEKAFIPLALVLAVLLLIVLAVAVFLCFKLNARAREDREDSISGIKNKAYY